ncbi:MAG TPA: hypothetical protein VM756_01150 [Burkholderiales bacterium]|nr:hypothetical protein [Burkholderiales bacterium]
MKTATITLNISAEHDLTKEELELAMQSAYEGAMRGLVGFVTASGHYVRTASKAA